MKKTTPPNDPQQPAAPELLEIARELKALRASLTSRDGEIATLRESLQWLHAELRERDERFEEELHELESAQEIAKLSGGDASRQIAYHQTIRRIRRIVGEVTPRGAGILVVSKGHGGLLKFAGRRGLHFPQDRAGVYAGFYPSNSLSAIAHLEALRSKGADFLLFPAPALWWLEKYADFRKHLDRRYRLVADEKDVCVIYSLRDRGQWAELDTLIAECREKLGRDPNILDWRTGANLAAVFSECTVFSPVAEEDSLPYLDRSVDIVVTVAAQHAEAQRVASEAVVTLTPVSERAGQFSLSIERDETAAQNLPATSIIIPCHNGSALTEGCLAALLETIPAAFNGEIIVVDDASTDDTAARLKKWAVADKRIKVIRNRTNAGFLASVNRGAAAATGDILVFLNNDTVPLPGWLPPLWRVLREHPDAGAVGGRLVFPEGTMQEAGGFVFADGSAAHFGRDDHQLDALHYNYVRTVDYCSAALLAVRRSLFEKIGGFDARYEPAYYEDTDFCMEIRKAGSRVYFQPESVVVHLEGASCGTDLNKGVKRHQQINAAKFTKKWMKVLKRKPARPAHGDTAAWRALALRGATEAGA